MAMSSSFPNREIASNIDRPSGMVRPLELNEENLKIPSILNSSNNRSEFSNVSGSINYRATFNFPTMDTFENIQTWATTSIPVDAAQATAGPSFSQFNDCNSSVSLMEFQSTEHVKQSSVHLKRHLKKDKIVRKGKRQYKCDVCQKLFRQNGDLQKHILIHTGQKPFQCGICKNSFRQKWYLQKHILIHTGEKPFQCKVCQKSFRQKHHLEMHFPIHSGEKQFQCKVCGKSITHNNNLKQHEIIHKDEKPFQCKVCGKSFRQMGTLKMHGRTHTGEKPHECKICGKKFSNKSNLHRHRKNHTPK